MIDNQLIIETKKSTTYIDLIMWFLLMFCKVTSIDRERNKRKVDISKG